MISTSLPALKESTAARPMPLFCAYRRVKAAMSRASVTTIPLNPISSLRSPSTIALDVVATRLGSESSAGTVTCATITASTPASMARRNVGSSVAVSGKMFGRGQHAALVSAADVRRHEIAYLLGVFSERARVDDGIRRIGIHVGIGEEIPMHSNGPRLERGDASEDFGIFRFAGRAKGHGMGENGRAIQTHGHSALEICRDNEG